MPFMGFNRREIEKEKEALAWISAIIGEGFPPYPEDEAMFRILRSGQVLCKLMNKLMPGSIKKINTANSEFQMMENVNNFTAACSRYGVPNNDIFQTVDLFEGRGISQVCDTIFALGRTTYKHPEYKGPHLGPKPAEETKREFSEEQLQASRNVIGLQAGTNKGASQAGQNFGAARRVIIGK